MDTSRHQGYTGCETEVNATEWLTDQMVAVSKAVNERRS